MENEKDNLESNEKRFGSLFTAKYPKLDSSINNAKSNPLLLDNISNHYIFEDEVHMSFSILRKYENILRNNLQLADFPKKYWYKPEYVSYAVYGTTDLWYLIMFVNNVYKNMDFYGDTLLLPTNDFIDAFNGIVSKENLMKKTIISPIKIYKHILKDLNSPSKQVLPSDFDKELDELTKVKDYEDVTDKFLNKDNFIGESKGIIEGVLHTNFYEAYTNKDVLYKDEILSADYSNLDNYEDEFLYTEDQKIRYDDSIIRIKKNGYLRPYKTGNYTFKVYTIGNFEMFIDDKNVISFTTDTESIFTDYSLNYFEEYSLNADFKRRNLDYWAISNHPTTNKPYELMYHSDRSKNMLNVKLENVKGTFPIYSATFPIDSTMWDATGDIFYTIDYLLPLEARYGNLVQTIILTKKDNTEVRYSHTSINSTYKRSYDFLCKEVMIIPREEFLDINIIKDVRLELSIEIKPSDIDKITHILISKIKCFTSKDNIGRDYTIHLDKNKLYKFNTVFQKIYNESDFFYLKYKYESELYKTIPAGWFSISAPTYSGMNGETDVDVITKYKNCILLNIYDLTSEVLLRQLLVLKMHQYCNILDEFNLPTGRTYKFSYRFFQLPKNQINCKFGLLATKLQRINFYTTSPNFKDIRFQGSNNNQENSVIVDIKDQIYDGPNNLIFDIITQQTVTHLDYLIMKETNTNSNIFDDFNKTEGIDFRYQERLPYSLVNGLFKMSTYIPLKNTIYREIAVNSIEDDWILSIDFLRGDEMMYDNPDLSLISSMSGIFGFIFDYIDSTSCYILIINLFSNKNYPSNGIYKFNTKYSLTSLNKTFLHKEFYENFTCIRELPELVINLSTNEKKNVIIMKRKGWIILREDNKKEPFLQFNENKNDPYHDGKLGYFSIDIDNINLDMTLWN